MISYDQFCSLTEKLGFSVYTYLPEDVFKPYKDGWEYSVNDIAELTGKSPVTVRKWFTTGKIKACRTNPWAALGKDVKNKLYIDHYPYVKDKIKVLESLDQKRIQQILNME
ncbi:hypothetical protein [Paenibacillus sp. NEAU-GSW1]|uniref:hypothetical protein n=1 Tax=Paenibacillus sp. NEAU-GSW1 TaxID=2682486 RepID=UPI0012E282D1|nr:hypothetical protein [Paenibacillus sp. NEAU-GSW1]MUT68495.1 hypothetical protein [Paenibacillus sp. NEAU-GSW1]